MRRKLASYRFASGVKGFVDPQTNPDGVGLKATVEEEGTGVFEAIVAVFGNVDLVGDRIVKGAFAKSLDRWRESGDPIPVIFDHQWSNLDAHAGEVLEVEERDEGLWIKGQLDLEDDFARKLYNKLKRRRIREMSFAYDVIDEKRVEDVNELRELDIIEVGPTLKGANPETQLLSVKSDPPVPDPEDDPEPDPQPDPEAADDEPVRIDEEAVKDLADALSKAGRVLSSKNETKLREARDLIDAVLASVQKEEDGGKAAVLNGRAMTPSSTLLRLQLLEVL